MFGWPCDETMEKLRDDFARETDPAKQKAIAEAVQARNMEMTQEIPLGQYLQPAAMRKNVKGISDCAGSGVLEPRGHQVRLVTMPRAGKTCPGFKRGRFP